MEEKVDEEETIHQATEHQSYELDLNILFLRGREERSHNKSFIKVVLVAMLWEDEQEVYRERTYETELLGSRKSTQNSLGEHYGVFQG